MSNPKAEPWFQRVAEKMVRESKTLLDCCVELGIPMTSKDAFNTERKKSFQQCIQGERNRYYAELANDPARTKNSLIGALLLVINRLMDEGKWRDASEALLKLAKIEGWVGEGTQINILKELTDSQLKAIERSILPQLPATNAKHTEVN